MRAETFPRRQPMKRTKANAGKVPPQSRLLRFRPQKRGPMEGGWRHAKQESPGGGDGARGHRGHHRAALSASRRSNLARTARHDVTPAGP